MTMVIPDAAEVEGLQAILATAVAEPIVLRLYQNNVTPDDNTVSGDLVESDFVGYLPILLDGVNWTYAPGDPSTAVHLEQIFPITAGQPAQDVYGYYGTRQTSGNIVFAELFTAGPYTTTQLSTLGVVANYNSYEYP